MTKKLPDSSKSAPVKVVLKAVSADEAQAVEVRGVCELCGKDVTTEHDRIRGTDGEDYGSNIHPRRLTPQYCMTLLSKLT